jgi:hypothetical protein
MFCAHGHASGGTEGVGSHFHVLRAQTHFRRYRGRRVPFSCFARPDLFLVELRASTLIFMFCVPRIVSFGTKVVESRFPILKSRTFFALPGTFSAVRRLSALDFKFCASRLIFDTIEVVSTRFYVLRARTSFQLYRGHWVLFLYFTLPDSFSAALGSSGSVFMFCAPGLIFDGIEGVGSHFHILRSRTHFRRYRGRRFSF